MYSYDDDTTLVAVVDGPGRHPEVVAISRWCRMWKMKLNVYKTKSMVIGRSITLLPHHPVLSEVGG